MAIKFLSSENIAGDIDVTLSKNGITYLAVTNTDTGVSANARVQVVGESAQIDIIATSAGYTGVSGWADSGIISTDSSASGGLILNSVAGIVKLQTSQTTALTLDASQNATFEGKIIGQDGDSVQLELKRTSSGTDGNTSIKFLQPLGDGYLGVNSSGTLSFGTHPNLIVDNKFKVDRNGNATFLGNVFLPTASSYIKLGGYSYIGEDLTELDSLTIASDSTESIYFAHFNQASSTYTTTAQIDSSGNFIVGNTTYGSSLGKVRIITDGASTPATLSLFGYNNIADQGIYASLDYAMQTSGTGGNVVASIKGVANGISENSSDIAFYTASGGTIDEKMRIAYNGQIGIGTTTNNLDGKLDLRMKFAGQSWVPDGTSAQWSKVWCNAGTPGTYFNDTVLHVDTNRGGGATGGVVGIAFSPGWQGHQNWGIYSFNTDGSSFTSGDLSFVSQLNDGTRIERMRLDGPTGHVGIGTDSPGAKLDVRGTGNFLGTAVSGAALVTIENNSGSTATSYGLLVIGGGDSSNGRTFEVRDASGNTDLIVKGNGDVGIGTASPSKALHVVGANPTIRVEANTTNWAALEIQSADTQSTYIFMRDSGGERARIQTTSSNDLQIYTGGGGVLGIAQNSSGKVGIGTTSPQSKLDLVQPDSSANTLGQSVTASLGIRMANAVGQVGQIVFNNDAAPSYGYGSIGMIMTSGSGVGLGDMIFATKSTGADNASTERMRITSGGDITVSGGDLFLNSGTNYNDKGVVYFSNERTAIISDIVNATANGDTSLDFQTRTSGTRASAMFIDEFKNIGIGTTSPVTKLEIYGNTSSGGFGVYPALTIKNDNGSGYSAVHFNQGASQKARIEVSNSAGTMGLYTTTGANGILINSSGKVGIGTTATPGRMLEVDGGTTQDGGIKLTTSNTTASFWSGIEFRSTVATSFIYMSADDADGTLKFLPDASLKGSLSKAGTWTVAGDVVAYGSPSDKRLKENIKPIESALDKVSKLQGVTFDWIQKEDQILDIKEDIGFIAQDVQKVIPELVRENEDGMLSMRHQGIAPILLEAIKELKAEIEGLKNKPCACNNCNCKE